MGDVDKKYQKLMDWWLLLLLIQQLVKNKLAVVSGLVKKTYHDTKLSQIEGKYLTNSDYNKITSDILQAKIKQKELVNKYNILNLVKNSDLSTELEPLAIKPK